VFLGRVLLPLLVVALLARALPVAVFLGRPQV
jgi:hypothetical protein